MAGHRFKSVVVQFAEHLKRIFCDVICSAERGKCEEKNIYLVLSWCFYGGLSRLIITHLDDMTLKEPY